jgi:hypothetical protein
MSFIEMFKDKFYFIGCDITREIRNHRKVKIVTFPKHTKSYAVRTGKISGITVLDFDTLYA